MRFTNYLNEATTGLAAWNKYFAGKDTDATVKKTVPIRTLDGKKTGESIEMGEKITVPASSSFEKGGITVTYKGVPIKIAFGAIRKPATTGGEKLVISATNLTKTAPIIEIDNNGKKFPARVFHNTTDLAVTLQNGFQAAPYVPDDLKEVMIANLSKGTYSTIDWMGYDNRQLQNEVAKYYGELLIGLIVMNGELGAISGNPIKRSSDVKSFVVPTDSSFAGVDSMFEMKDGTFVSVSSKSGAGAPASFHANLVPKLVEMDKVSNSGSKILKAIVDLNKNTNLRNMQFIYQLGLGYLMAPYMKNAKLKSQILKNPYAVYTNILKNNITELELYVFDVVRDNKWPIMKNQKLMIDGLPNSLTYFMCQNIAELMNKDKNCMTAITKALGFKNYWQANLAKASFLKGTVKFKMVNSGKGKVTMKQGKGSSKSIKSEQGRLSYEIK